MIEWSKYEKICELKNDLLTRFAPNKENVVYYIKFTDDNIKISIK